MARIKLGIDTTNNNLCYALILDNSVLYYENIYPCSSAAEDLAPKIADMLKNHHIRGHDITDIVSVTGPGGFSGVRIGTAFLTGFIAQSSINLIGISSLEAVALSVVKPQQDSVIIACLNARREGVYIAIFDCNYQRLTPDAVINIADLSNFLQPYLNKPFYICGHGSDIMMPHLNNQLCLEVIPCSLAQEFTQKAGLIKNPYSNQPIYLRPPDAKLSTKRKKVNIKSQLSIRLIS